MYRLPSRHLYRRTLSTHGWPQTIDRASHSEIHLSPLHLSVMPGFQTNVSTTATGTISQTLRESADFWLLESANGGAGRRQAPPAASPAVRAEHRPAAASRSLPLTRGQAARRGVGVPCRVVRLCGAVPAGRAV